MSTLQSANGDDLQFLFRRLKMFDSSNCILSLSGVLKCRISDLKSGDLEDIKFLSFLVIHREHLDITIGSWAKDVCLDILNLLSNEYPDEILFKHLKVIFDECAKLLPPEDQRVIASKLLLCASENLRQTENVTDDSLPYFYLLDLTISNISTFSNSLEGHDLETISEQIVNQMLKNNHALTMKMMHYFLKLLNFPKSDILKIAWLKICTNYEDANSACLLVLSLLHKSFFTVSPFTYEMTNSDCLWLIIKKGVISFDNNDRKHSLHILRNAVGVLSSDSKLFINRLHFKWDGSRISEYTNLWNKMLIIFETLEEKQVHIVSGALKSVKGIFHEFCVRDNMLDVSWVMLIFFNAFNHCSLSVKRWSLQNFLFFPISVFSDSLRYRFLLEILVKSLNHMSLFSRCSSDSDDIGDVLQNWFNSWSNDSMGPAFFRDYLSCLSKNIFGPVPLFYLIHSMAMAKGCHSITHCDIPVLKTILLNLKNYPTFLRLAIHSDLCIVLTKYSDFNLPVLELSEFLLHFDALTQGTCTWNSLVTYIQSYPEGSFEEIINRLNFLTDSSCSTVSVRGLVKMFLLLLDASVIRSEDATKLCENVCNFFDQYEKRAYCNQLHLDKITVFINAVLNEYKPSSDPSGKERFNAMLSQPLKVISKLLLGYLTNLESIDVYNEYLTLIPSDSYLRNSFSIFFNSNQSLIVEILCSHQFSTQIYIAFQICHIATCLLDSESSEMATDFIASFEKIIFYLLKQHGLRLKFSFDNESDFVLSKGKTRLNSNLIEGFWNMLGCFLDLGPNQCDKLHELVKIDNVLSEALLALDMGSKEVVISVERVLLHLLPRCDNVTLLDKLVSICWQSILCLRKTISFWPACKGWCLMVFQDSVLKKNSCMINECLNNFLETSKDVNGLLRLAFRQMQSLSSVPEFLLDFIINAIVFGPIPSKYYRYEFETVNYVKSLGAKNAANAILPQDHNLENGEARLRAIALVYDHRNEIMISVVEKLIENDSKLFANKKRYFIDSLQHRIRHRSLQALLIFASSLIDYNDVPNSDPMIFRLLDWCETLISTDSQQASVRYQIEWLMVKIYVCFDHLIPARLWPSFTKPRRTGGICSLISVAFHIAKFYRDDAFYKKCFKYMIPWCMSQNFSTRLYAQIALQALRHHHTVSKYDFLWENISVVYNQGNLPANTEKLANNFFFHDFDTEEDFNLRTIFWDLPRLSGISSDEWIPLDFIERNLTGLKLISSRLFSEGIDSSLPDCTASTWHIRGDDESEVEVDVSGIQKKYAPPCDDLLDENASRISNSDLIVVASLIDKVPNLGGLTRTCDVFAASQLVIPSLEAIKDKQFLHLSMSAEKHVNISQVKPHNLKEYLIKMKENGYSIVGAEQTADSVVLTNFNFPKKTVLLLGSEKEGIDMHLLPLLDFSVEVPQYGVIRSLNVHVTGALFIWEYSKQHLNK